MDNSKKKDKIDVPAIINITDKKAIKVNRCFVNNKIKESINIILRYIKVADRI